MRTIVATTVLLSVCLSSATYSEDDRCGAFKEFIPICSVLSDATKYDGKEITVKGIYRTVLHGSVLMSPACGQTYVNLRQVSAYKADKQASAVMRSITKKDQFESVEVILRGTFRAAHQGQCFGQNCLPYEFEDHELLCAARPPADPKDAANSKGTTH